MTDQNPTHFQLVDRAYEKGAPYLVPGSLELVVSGFTRGGTQYTANVLRRLGVAAGHEASFAAKGPRGFVPQWKKHDVTVEVSGLAAPWVPCLARGGVRIVHLLRHPVACINSNLHFFHHENIPWADACETYLRWHKLTELFAHYTVHVERFADECYPLIAMCYPNPPPSDRAVEEALRFAYKGERTWTEQFGGWADLPTELQDYAAKHGYGDQ